MIKIAVVGGGAAGFFSAIAAKENHPNFDVTILEKSNEPLAKVRISGGGRCNVTNGCKSIKQLSVAYPRGGRFLQKLFPIFNTKHTIEWFESKGVELVTQKDNCVFPKSQNSESIIDCFNKESKRLGIKIELGKGVKKIEKSGVKLKVHYIGKKYVPELFDKVIITTGGSPKRLGLEWLENLGHKIEDPVPSLFTFNMPDESVKKLMGVVVEKTLVSIEGTKLKSEGPLLITHWGMSGPAILKLSAFGARVLSEKDYRFTVQVNWVNEQNNNVVLEELKAIIDNNPNKVLSNIRPYLLPDRLWQYLLKKAELPQKKKWNELGKKGLNKLVTLLTNDKYNVEGKTTFKEEFVTCGGVSLESVNSKTMESKECKNLYFAGEVLDIDGITGGYNFQAAWTTGFIAGKLG